MNYTTVPGKATGDTITETNWDTHIAANINNLIMPPSASIRHSATQSIANNSWVTLAFNTENWDTDAIHDNATNNSRLTCKTAGKYLVIAHAEFDANATGTRIVRIDKGGVNQVQEFSPAAALGLGPMGLTAHITLDMAVNDVVTMLVCQDSGGAINVTVNTWFAMGRIG